MHRSKRELDFGLASVSVCEIHRGERNKCKRTVLGFQSLEGSLHLVKRMCLLASIKDWGMKEFCSCFMTASNKPPKLQQLLASVLCRHLLSAPWRKGVLSASWEKRLGQSDSRWERMGWLLYSQHLYGTGQSKGLRELGDKLCGSLRLLLKPQSKEKSWL